jgi:MFS family permease
MFGISLLPMMVSSGMIYSVLPIYLSDELGANKVIVGSLFTIGALVGTLNSLLAGKIADKYGKKPLVIISQAFFAVMMLGYSMISEYIYAYPLHIIEGFAWSTIGVSAPALIADITTKGERGMAMGTYGTIMNLGWVIGPVFGGTLAEIFGFRVMLRLSTILIIFGIILSYISIEKE